MEKVASRKTRHLSWYTCYFMFVSLNTSFTRISDRLHNTGSIHWDIFRNCHCVPIRDTCYLSGNFLCGEHCQRIPAHNACFLDENGAVNRGANNASHRRTSAIPYFTLGKNDDRKVNNFHALFLFPLFLFPRQASPVGRNNFGVFRVSINCWIAVAIRRHSLHLIIIKSNGSDIFSL